MRGLPEWAGSFDEFEEEVERLEGLVEEQGQSLARKRKSLRVDDIEELWERYESADEALGRGLAESAELGEFEHGDYLTDEE